MGGGASKPSQDSAILQRLEKLELAVKSKDDLIAAREAETAALKQVADLTNALAAKKPHDPTGAYSPIKREEAPSTTPTDLDSLQKDLSDTKKQLEEERLSRQALEQELVQIKKGAGNDPGVEVAATMMAMRTELNMALEANRRLETEFKASFSKALSKSSGGGGGGGSQHEAEYVNALIKLKSECQLSVDLNQLMERELRALAQAKAPRTTEPNEESTDAKPATTEEAAAS